MVNAASLLLSESDAGEEEELEPDPEAVFTEGAMEEMERE